MVIISLTPKPVPPTVTCVVVGVELREIVMLALVARAAELALMYNARQAIRTTSEHIIFILKRKKVDMKNPRWSRAPVVVTPQIAAGRVVRAPSAHSQASSVDRSVRSAMLAPWHSLL